MASSTNQLTLILGVADRELRVGLKRAQESLKGLNKSLEITGKRGQQTGKQVSAGVKEMNLSLDSGRKKIARFSEAVRSSVVNLRYLASALAGGALTSGIVKFGSEYEKALANINTLLRDNTVSIEEFNVQLKALAATTPKDLLDLSNALYQIVSAGVPAADAMQVLDASVKLAVSSISEVKDSANLLITTLNAYRGSGLDAADATDKLTRIYQDGRTTVTELAGSFGRVAPLAAQFGVSLDEVGGLLISLTRSGLRTNEAITATRAIISGIAKPTLKTQKILERLGIAFGQGAIDANGFTGVMENLLNATGGNVDVLARLFPNIRALLPAIVAAGSGFGEFSDNVESVANSFGAADEALAKTDDKFFKSAALLRSNFQNILVSISEDILPQLLVKFDALSDFLSSDRGQRFADNLGELLSIAIEVASTFGNILIRSLERVFDIFEGFGEPILKVVKALALAKVAAVVLTPALLGLSKVFASVASAAGFAATALVSRIGAAAPAIALGFSRAGATAGLGFVAGIKSTVNTAVLSKIGAEAGAKTVASFGASIRSVGLMRYVATGFGILVSGAFKFLVGGFLVVSLAQTLIEAIFGQAEREAEERRSKAKRELEREAKRIETLLKKLEKERRGGTSEQIEEARESPTAIDLTQAEQQDLIGQFPELSDRFAKEAGRIIQAQELFRVLTAQNLKQLGEQGTATERQQKAQQLALEQLSKIIRSRLEQTGQIISQADQGSGDGFRGILQQVGVEIKKRRRQVEQLNRDFIKQFDSATRAGLEAAYREGRLDLPIREQLESQQRILSKAREEFNRLQKDIVTDANISKEQRVAQIADLKKSYGELGVAIKTGGRVPKTLANLFGVLEDGNEIVGRLGKTADVTFNRFGQIPTGFEEVNASLIESENLQSKINDLVSSYNQKNQTTKSDFADIAAEYDGLIQKATERGDNEEVNRLTALKNLQVAQGQKTAADQRLVVLRRILVLAQQAGVETSDQLKDAIKRNQALSDFLKNLIQSLKAQKALKKETRGTGRAIDYNKRLQEALLRLQEKTAKLRRQNSVDAARQSVAAQEDLLKILREEEKLISSQNSFYGAQPKLLEQVLEIKEQEIQKINEVSKARLAAIIVERKAERAGLEERVSAERKRLESLFRGNAARGARGKRNREKIERELIAFRKAEESKFQNFLNKTGLEQAQLERKRIADTRKVRREAESTVLREVDGRIAKTRDEIALIEKSIDLRQNDRAASAGLREFAGTSLELITFNTALINQQKDLLALARERLDTLSKIPGKEKETAEARGAVKDAAEKLRELQRTVSADEAFGDLLNVSGRAEDLFERQARAEQLAQKGAEGLGEKLERVPFHLRRSLEEAGALPSAIQDINRAAESGILGERGGLIFGATAGAGDLVDTLDELRTNFDEAGPSFRDSVVDSSILFARQVGNTIRSVPATILNAADRFAITIASGLQNVGTGDFSFVTEAAQQFALNSTGYLTDTIDLVGSRFGTTIGNAFGETGEGFASEIGGKAGTAFGLVANSILGAALSAVGQFVVSPVQAAISSPFQLLSSGISEAFGAIGKEGALSEEAFSRRMSMLDAEHALRIEQIEEEANKKAGQIDEELALTQDIAKIQELTAKREEVRAERDEALLEERRKQAEKERELIEKREESGEGLIDKYIEQALDLVNRLVEELPGLAVKAVESLTTVLPELIVKAAQALGDTLSAIAPLMGDLIKNIVRSLIDALPFILKGAADFVVGLVEGIIEGFLQILENIDEVVGPFIQAIVRAAPRIIGAVIRALPRLIAALIAALPLIVLEAFKGVGEFIKNIFSEVGEAILSILSFGLSESPKKVTGALAGAAGGALAGAAIGGVPGAIVGGIAGGLAGALSFHDGGHITSKMSNPGLASMFSGLGARGYATGGMVDGIQNSINGSRLRAFRRGVDDVPAVLQAGEAVLNRQAVTNLGEETINALNSGSTPVESGPTSVNISINPNANGLGRVVSQILPYLIDGVNAEIDRPGSKMRINSMTSGNRPLGTMRPRRA